MDKDDPRRKNLRPWTKGNAPKSPGRPKGETLTNLIRKYLEKDITDPATGEKIKIKDAIVAAMMKAATKGDPKLIKEILDRTEGKVTQPREHSDLEGATIIIKWADESVDDNRVV